jgi:hypothetical protein
MFTETTSKKSLNEKVKWVNFSIKERTEGFHVIHTAFVQVMHHL